MNALPPNSGPPNSGLPNTIGRQTDSALADRRVLREAIDAFDAQLVREMLRGMRSAFLEEQSGASGLYSDFADGFLASALSQQSPDGVFVTGELRERLQGLDGSTRIAHVSLPQPILNLEPTIRPIPIESLAPTPTPPSKAPEQRSPTVAHVALPAPLHDHREDVGDPVVTSPYGRRSDPFHGRSRFHHGVDLRAARGTAVAATRAGVVVRAVTTPGYGRQVVVRHEGGYESLYAHLDAITVEEGARVEAGQTIGAVGSSGRATGPHLHFEVRRDDQTIDPATLLDSPDSRWRWPVAGAVEGGLDETA